MEPEKRELTPVERGVIELAISGMTAGQTEARQQLAVATYGGPAHPGKHVCFLIDVPESAPLIPDGSVLPITLIDENASEDAYFSIEMFLNRGRLSSVDLTNYGDDALSQQWPSLNRLSVL